MLTRGKSTNIIDIAQDHSGHFCLHKERMKDQPKSWEVARTVEIPTQVTCVTEMLGLSLSFFLPPLK